MLDFCSTVWVEKLKKTEKNIKSCLRVVEGLRCFASPQSAFASVTVGHLISSEAFGRLS
jgi:hypothetical protein